MKHFIPSRLRASLCLCGALFLLLGCEPDRTVFPAEINHKEAPPAMAVTRWGVAELQFDSDKEYAHPLWDVNLSVVYTTPSGLTMKRDGFWDGGKQWLARISPGQAGLWKWKTACSDAANAGLHNRSGQFMVTLNGHSRVRIAGDTVTDAGFMPWSQIQSNPFYLHGSLKLSDSRTHLVHADGTPFFWLADTAWNGILRSSEADWERYLTVRESQGFTAVQVVGTQWRGGRTVLPAPIFTGDKRIGVNPQAMRQLDQRIAAVNAHRMLAAPVLLWALKPDDPGQALADDDAVKLARYLVARWGAYQVAWFLGGDGTYAKHKGGIDRWKWIGWSIFADQHDRLVTLHPSGQSWIGDDFAGEQWFDFVGYQSGHGSSDAALKWLIEGPVARRSNQIKPIRPIINLEPNYEGHPSYQTKAKFTDLEVRRASYWSMLLAPPAGITYGNNAIWNWNTTPGTAEGHQNLGQIGPWQEGLELPGIASMTILKKFFESGPWTKLRPAPQLLAGQTGDWKPADFVAAAATAAGDWAVIYTPAGRPFRLNTHDLRAKAIAEWFDPRTGKTRPADPLARGAIQSFTPPDPNDWVLSIRVP